MVRAPARNAGNAVHLEMQRQAGVFIFQVINVNGVHAAITHFATATTFQCAGSAGTFWQADHTPISCFLTTSFLDWTAIKRK